MYCEFKHTERDLKPFCGRFESQRVLENTWCTHVRMLIIFYVKTMADQVLQSSFSDKEEKYTLLVAYII